jgi:hypothetical protein
MKIKADRRSSNVHEPRAEGGSVLCRLIRKNTENILPTGWSEKVQDE